MTRHDGPDEAVILDLARDPQSRRRYLIEAIARLPDYSPARKSRIRGLLVGVTSDLARMILAGVPASNPALWAETQARATQIREMNDELVAADERNNSSRAGKALVASHLNEATPFILLLRSFESEARPGGAPPEFTLGGMPLGSVELTGDRALRRLSESLADDCASLLIVNENDLLPPQASAKLYASNDEWRQLVFCLVAEARLLLISVPIDRSALSLGLSDELRAIEALSAQHRTIIVLEQPGFALRAGAEPVDASDALEAALSERGFPHLLRDRGDDGAEEILALARTLLNRGD